MKSIRKLYFQNSANQRFGLNGENGVYATALSGFGFSLSSAFAGLGGGFYPKVKDSDDLQGALAFSVVLTRNPYLKHQEFVDWLNSAGTLTIVYNPTGDQEYCRDVTVRFVEKGELNKVGWLELLCSFSCITPWYLPVPAQLQISGSAADAGKRYDYTYAEQLRYGPDSDAYMSAALAGTGHVPGALQVVLRGAITNPKLKLVGNRTGKVIGICSLPVTLSSTDRLEYSSQYEDSYVRKVSADGTVTDMLDVSDLSLTPFFRVPVSEPSTLSVEADEEFSGAAELKVYYYFRSV